MSEERRNQHLSEERFPEEERLSRLYREGSGDLPPAHLDVVILDAARQAARSRPRRLYFFPSRKWAIPLSLAAALWVTVEVVLMHRNDFMKQSRLSVKEPSSALHVKPAEEEKARMDNEEFDALSEPVGRAKKEILAPESAEDVRKSTTEQSLYDERQIPEEERVLRPRMAEIPQSQLQKAAPAELPAREQKSVEAVLSAPVPASPPPASAVAGAIATDILKEQVLSPKEWLAKIQKLRRAGKHAEAEASLKEFKKRYPEYPVEKFLREQPEALQTPRE